MDSSDKELEQQLEEAGNRLTDPPSSVDELLPLLDHVERCLSRVEQSPSKSMQKALSPSLTALVTDKLFRHSNGDVKVAVASCISEITRITAPEAPYDDEQMKEVFQLIVSSFEDLVDKSSPSYAKRTSILETVAKVRSCVVMLDLECDALIIEMFQHFLKAIRDYHPENVFSSMETIMTLVLEESEDISPELLSPVLASIKKDNEHVLPVARKLAERVLGSCATKLKPYLLQAIKSLGSSLDDYSQVVGSICQETSGAMEQNDVTTNEHVADESKSERTSTDKAAEVDKKIATEATPEQDGPSNERSPKSVVSNGVAETGEEDRVADPNSIKKQEHGDHTDPSKTIHTSSNIEVGSLSTEKVIDAEHKQEQEQEQTTKKRGRKASSLKVTEPSNTSRVDVEKEAETPADNKDGGENVPSSPCDEPSGEAAMSSENEKAIDAQLPSPKAMEDESMNVASPSPSASLAATGRPKKTGPVNKNESSMKETAPSVDDISKKASEETSDSEAKPNSDFGKKVASESSDEDKTATLVDPSKKESGTASDSEAKLPKLSAKKVVASTNNVEESSKQTADKKRRGRGKVASEKGASKIASKDDDKEMDSSPKSARKLSKDGQQMEETPKTNSKRKRTPGKENPSDSKDYGEDLVGSRIKVWWPKDHMFYKGVVDSFISVRKKHKVLYDDGDEEVLNLKRERWEFIDGDSESAEEEADHPSPDASSEMPQKKKAKTNSDQSSKQGKVDALPKRGGGASSSKSKAAATKLGRKPKDDNKVESKVKDGSKALSKSENDNVGKGKDHSAKGSGKLSDFGSKLASKSKDDASGTPKSSKSKEDSSGTLKSKQETPKTSKSKEETMKGGSNAKVKPPKSGGKSNVNGSGKLKSGSYKVQDNYDMEEDSTDLAEALENTKGKSPSSSKAHGSEAKSGKKRRR